MLAPAARLNCLIIVTGCSTRKNTATAAVITKTAVTKSTTTTMPLGWRWSITRFGICGVSFLKSS